MMMFGKLQVIHFFYFKRKLGPSKNTPRHSELVSKSPIYKEIAGQSRNDVNVKTAFLEVPCYKSRSPATLSAIACPCNAARTVRPKLNASPGPLPVMMFPSTTTGALVSVASFI